jgi:tRNA uridine 5-carbamoylmethylation protein Kti12
MPLVMMCGYPGSGKSTRALELFGYLKGLGREVVIVSEESLNIDRTEGYKGAHPNHASIGPRSLFRGHPIRDLIERPD